jgi:hypothetical protein
LIDPELFPEMSVLREVGIFVSLGHTGKNPRDETIRRLTKMRRNSPINIHVRFKDIVVSGILSEMFCQGFPLDRKSQFGIMTPGFRALTL